MRRRLWVLAVLTLALGATACGSDGGTGVTPSGSPDPRTSLGSPTFPTAPPEREQTLQGTIEAGAERGCLLLRTDTTAYVLVGLRSALLPGATVALRGRVDHGLRTTCQGGDPLVVTEVLSVTGGVDPAT